LWKADNEPNIDPQDVSSPSGAILSAASRGGRKTLGLRQWRQPSAGARGAKLLHDVGFPQVVNLIAGLTRDTVDEVAQSCKIAGRFVRNAMKYHKRDR
jgi:hypothetical protein